MEIAMETFPPNSVGGSPPTSPPPLNLDHFSSSRDFTKVALSGSGCQTGVPLIPPPIQATPPHPFLFFEGGGYQGDPPTHLRGGRGGAPPLACQRFPVDLRGIYDGVLVFRQVSDRGGGETPPIGRWPPSTPSLFFEGGGVHPYPPSPSGSLRPPCRIRAGSGSNGVIV